MVNKLHIHVDKNAYLTPWDVEDQINVEVRFPFLRTGDVVLDFPGKQSLELLTVSSRLLGVLEGNGFQVAIW